MDLDEFLRAVRPLITNRDRPQSEDGICSDPDTVGRDDPCPDVVGMASTKKLWLLNRAVAYLPAGGAECYLEVGTYQGKSLIAALAGNPDRLGVACDNFSQFDDPARPRNRAILERNLARHHLADQVRFYDCDFRVMLDRWGREGLPPVGAYFYDGAHDEASHHDGLRLAEDALADRAVIIVDDWRHAADSGSFAEAGTRRAISGSAHQWQVEHVLTARFNGDLEEWWNGVAVLTFRRSGPDGYA